MASTFFIVHHQFKPGKAAAWWDIAMSAMSDEAGWAAAVAANLDAGFFNHSFNPTSPDGPVFCVWEARDGITAEQFQDFIDGPTGPNMGINAFNNNSFPVNVELTGGQTPYPPKFS
ncbi:MAG: hypothetical protein CMO60_00285 [Verrucomicrobiales bacterium]|nr:hypothetical protein [Verrucomicrobiales bacterium]